MCRTCLGLAATLLAVSLVGCASDGGGGIMLMNDAGRRTDGGVSPGIDAGMLPDSGTMPRTDSGTMPRTDGGTTAMCMNAGPVPPVTMVSCAASTLTCLMGCMDAACQDRCIMADPMAEGCNGCLLQNQVSCATSMGCQSQWDNFICCAERAGCLAMGAAMNCVDTNCATESGAMDTCLMGIASRCTSTLLQCFPR